MDRGTHYLPALLVHRQAR